LQSLIFLPINFRKAVFVNIRLNKQKIKRNNKGFSLEKIIKNAVLLREMR
jgi:hypothetical protein